MTTEAPVVADLEFALDQVDTLGRSIGVTKTGAKRCLQWLRVVLIDSCLDWLRQQCYLWTSHYKLGLLQSCHFDCYLEAAGNHMTS